MIERTLLLADRLRLEGRGRRVCSLEAHAFSANESRQVTSAATLEDGTWIGLASMNRYASVRPGRAIMVW